MHKVYWNSLQKKLAKYLFLLILFQEVKLGNLFT